MERLERKKVLLALGLFLKRALPKASISLLPGPLQGLLEAVDGAYREASNDPRVRVHEFAGVLAEGAFGDEERELVAERVVRAVLGLDPASLRTTDLRKVRRMLFPEPPFPEEGLNQLAYRVAEEFLRWYFSDPEVFAQVGSGALEVLDRRFSELVEEREREREAERLRIWDDVVGPLSMPPPDGLGLSVRVLSAKFGLVPFSTLPLFDVILKRVESGSGVAVLQVEGPGGIGKTRLLQEVGRELIARGWRGGVLRRGADLERMRRLFEQAEAPLFFLVDYAGTRVRQVRELLSAAAGVGWERPLAVLLAERYPLEEELRSKLLRDEDRVGLDAWLWARGVRLECYELGPLDRATAVQVYEEALQALAEFAGGLPPEVGEPPPWDRPLYLALDALLRLAGRESEHGVRKDRLLEDALNYERSRWHRFLENIDGTDWKRAVEALDLLVAAVVLAGGLSRRETAELRRHNPLHDYGELGASVENAAFSALGDAQGERLLGLEPDPVADALLGRVGTERLRPLTRALLEVFFSALEEEALFSRVEAVLAVLERVGIGERDELGLLRPWEFFLAHALSTLGPGVFDRAARLLQKADPNHPLLVRPVHLVLAGATVLRAQAAGDLPGLAWSSGILGNLLAALGRHEEALGVTGEAVEIRRALAEQNPGAYRPYLATSLGLLSHILRDLGRDEDALGSAREGIQLLTTHFLRFPQAFGALMSLLLREYTSTVSKLRPPMDRSLLCPLLEAKDWLWPEPVEWLREVCERSE